MNGLRLPGLRMAQTAATALAAVVAMSAPIVASDPGDDASMFEPAEDKIYRHPTFYDIPDGITHI